MPLTATPLSSLYQIKTFSDEVRSICSEIDEQQISDDNIKAHTDWAILNMYRTLPPMRLYYIVAVPFVVDYDVYVADADMAISTLITPVTSKTARVTDVKPSPSPAQAPALLTTGMYDFHYTKPTNFHVNSWWNVYNELTGTVGRTSDFSQLMGYCLNNNVQLARTSRYYDAGAKLWLSVREGMKGVNDKNVIHVGMGFRSYIPCIILQQMTAPTGWPDNSNTSGNGGPLTPASDESVRHAPQMNDWAFLDCPDDYVPLALNLTAIKTRSQVEKVGREQEQAAIESAYASMVDNTEMNLMQRENYRRATQWKDQGHQ